MLGQAFAYAPNVSAAILSAGRLLKLFERTPALHSPHDKPYNTAEVCTRIINRLFNYERNKILLVFIF